jgi:hypothetical protein
MHDDVTSTLEYAVGRQLSLSVSDACRYSDTSERLAVLALRIAVEAQLLAPHPDF